jgi:hypothetical protein
MLQAKGLVSKEAPQAKEEASSRIIKLLLT